MAVSARIQQIYLALFGRPADPVGGEFYDSLTHDGANLDPILTGASRLSGSAEYTTRFTGMNNTQIVETIYLSLFGHTADLAGLTFYVQAMANGEAQTAGQPLPFPGVPAYTIEQIAVGILDGATGDDAIIIANKTAAAELFTDSLNTNDEIAAYQGDAAAQAGRDFISHVGLYSGTIPTQQDVDQAIANLHAFTNTIELSAGQDTVVGTDGNDLINAKLDANGNETFTAFDHINGGNGDDTLRIYVDHNSYDLPTSATVENVEHVEVFNDGNNLTVDATLWTGLEDINFHQYSNNADVTIYSGSATQVKVSGSNYGASDDIYIEDTGPDQNLTDVWISEQGSGGHSDTTIIGGGVSNIHLKNIDANDSGSRFEVRTGLDTLNVSLDGVGINLDTSAGLVSTLNLTVEGGYNDVDLLDGDNLVTLNISGTDGYLDVGAHPSQSGNDSLTDVNVTGDVDIYADLRDDDSLANVNNSGNAGDVSFYINGDTDGGDIDGGVNYQGGSGQDWVQVQGNTNAVITLGAEDDTLFYLGNEFGTAGSADGGNGTDTLAMLVADAATASASGDFETHISSFESLDLSYDLSSISGQFTVDLANLDDISDVTVGGITGGTQETQHYVAQFSDANGGVIRITYGDHHIDVDIPGNQTSDAVAQIIQDAINSNLSSLPGISSVTDYGYGEFIIHFDASEGDVNDPAVTFDSTFGTGFNVPAPVQTDGVNPVLEVTTFNFNFAVGVTGNYQIDNHDIHFEQGFTAQQNAQAAATVLANLYPGATVSASGGVLTIQYNVPGNQADPAYTNTAIFTTPPTYSNTDGDNGTSETQTFDFSAIGASAVEDGQISVAGYLIDVPAGTTNDQLGTLISSNVNNINTYLSNNSAGYALSSINYNTAGHTLTVVFTSQSGNVGPLDIHAIGSNPVAEPYFSDTHSYGVLPGELDLVNMASGGTVHFTSTIDGILDIGVTNAAAGTNDVINLDLTGSNVNVTGYGDSMVNGDGGVVRIANVETVNIATDSDPTDTYHWVMTLQGGAKSIIINGNTGVDFSADGNTDTSNLTLLDATSVTKTGNAGSVSIFGASSSGATLLTGAGDDHIGGGDGNDIINTGSGNDSLTGGLGADTLTGGAGNDTFWYNSAADSSGVNVDTITDFVSGTDKIDLHNVLGGTGAYLGEANGFIAAQTALTHTVGDTVFDTVTHQIYVDVDGNGAIDAMDMVITLTGVSDLSGSDFNF